MKWNKLYKYPSSTRSLVEGQRHYDVSNEKLPFMGYVEGDLFGIKARIFRISFSGELAYEINVESDFGLFMWEKIIQNQTQH